MGGYNSAKFDLPLLAEELKVRRKKETLEKKVSECIEKLVVDIRLKVETNSFVGLESLLWMFSLKDSGCT